MGLLGNTAQINSMRLFQESLMTDSCAVYRDGVIVPWSRTNAVQIPCRVGHVHVFPASGDPLDARAKDLSVIAVTLPFDYDIKVADQIDYAGETLIVGETNAPQTWLIAMRAHATKQKSAVGKTSVTFRRRSFDTGAVTTVGTYNVRIIFNKEQPIEVPARYSTVSGSSYRSVTIIFDDGISPPLEKDDFFEYDDKFGFVQYIVPNQPIRVEVYAWLDFGSSR